MDNLCLLLRRDSTRDYDSHIGGELQEFLFNFMALGDFQEAVSADEDGSVVLGIAKFFLGK